MYMKQVLLSAFAAFGITTVAVLSGLPLYPAIAILGLSFILSRWTLSTFGRTRYWLDRGTGGVYTARCPNCNSNRYRLSGDWILTCRSCGWKPGFPVLRWFTQSVPAIQFRRSIDPLGSFLVGVLLTFLVTNWPKTVRPPSLTIQYPTFPELEQVVQALAVLILMSILVWLALRPRDTYCRNCGQYLGRGKPEEVCPKCGSNRFTHEDPGVGLKIRTE